MLDGDWSSDVCSSDLSAQGYIAAVAQQQLQYFIDNRSYAPTPEALGTTPPSQVSSHYSVAIQLTTDQPQGFLVTATPSGDQAEDTCATLSINSAGTKTSSSGTNCW
jgi:type IV pilus assembly protein PilE